MTFARNMASNTGLTMKCFLAVSATKDSFHGTVISVCCVSFPCVLNVPFHVTRKLLTSCSRQQDVGLLPDGFETVSKLGDQLQSVGEFVFSKAASDSCYTIRFREALLYVRRAEVTEVANISTVQIRRIDKESTDRPSDWVFPLSRCELFGRPFPCPNNADACLRSLYGDYMRMPWTPRVFVYLYHPLDAPRLLYVVTQDGRPT